jgi:hypothetical protein
LSGLVSSALSGQEVDSVTVLLDGKRRLSATLIGNVWKVFDETGASGLLIPADEMSHTLELTAVTTEGCASVTKTLTLRINPSAQASYAYDLNGNLLQTERLWGPLEIASYTYDARNRLVRARRTIGRKIIHEQRFQYDAWNRRMAIVTAESERLGSVTKNFFLYDGQRELGMTDQQGNVLQFRVLGEGLGAEVGAAVAMELPDPITNEMKTHVALHDQRGTLAQRKHHPCYH